MGSFADRLVGRVMPAPTIPSGTETLEPTLSNPRVPF
jgi:hypothetical protein